MKQLKILNHPLVKHYLSIIRDKNTGKIDFKNSLEKISYILAAEAYSSLGLETRSVNTPFKKINGSRVKDKIVIITIILA